MARSEVEKKHAVWRWMLAAIIVLILELVLFWLLIRAFDAGVEPAAGTARPAASTPSATEGARPRVNDPAIATGVAAPGTSAAVAAVEAVATATAMQQYAGAYGSDTVQLALAADGTYATKESPAGEGRDSGVHDAGSNRVRVTPTDGSPGWHFGIEDTGTLTPLDAGGVPAAQMAPLTRQASQ